MYNNGVSHAAAKDDLKGIYTILKWLSYIPKVKSDFFSLCEKSWNIFEFIYFPKSFLGFENVYVVKAYHIPF